MTVRMDAAAILVDGLEKTYGSGSRAVAALRGVRLSVAPGEIYGLLGRNGAGKTTLVKILLDIVRPTGGEARLLGRETRDAETRRSVGYLPEDHRFPEHHTAETALLFYGSLSGLSPAECRARTPRLLDLVGLAAAAKRKVRSYSKGMKQRLGLAQALVHDPRVLFLDEPTDGVDPVGRAEIRAVLERLKAEGKTIFLNSHLLSEVERICDRVGILDRGQLVREGTMDDLTRADLAFRIETAPALDAAALGALAGLVLSAAPAANGKGHELKVAREADIDAVIDRLRERGIGIRALDGKRFSLEEVFLGAVEKEPAR